MIYDYNVIRNVDLKHFLTLTFLREKLVVTNKSYRQYVCYLDIFLIEKLDETNISVRKEG